MDPILFEAGPFTVYSYGFMIAVGIVAGVVYMAMEGKREVALTFDQANALFLVIFVAALLGGKFFLFLEDPARYAQHPGELLAGSGFVFYGSFLFAVPAMWWYFRKHRLPPFRMLDVMAVTTCVVHFFGRIGCFLAGCCHGSPTDSAFGVVFTDPACLAEPLNTPLFPTQLFEATWILMVMIFLLLLKRRRQFYGQLFFSYLLLYAVGRFFLEYFRGDAARGFVADGYLSHGQVTALLVFLVVLFLYVKRRRHAPPAVQ